MIPKIKVTEVRFRQKSQNPKLLSCIGWGRDCNRAAAYKSYILSGRVYGGPAPLSRRVVLVGCTHFNSGAGLRIADRRRPCIDPYRMHVCLCFTNLTHDIKRQNVTPRNTRKQICIPQHSPPSSSAAPTPAPAPAPALADAARFSSQTCNGEVWGRDRASYCCCCCCCC